MIRKWRICKANLDPVIGSEQGKTRPVLVVSEDAANNLLNVINVLPITSRKQNRRVYPNEVLLPSGKGGLPDESIVLCYQIRTLDKQRLLTKYGDLEDLTLQEQVYETICFQLGIDR